MSKKSKIILMLIFTLIIVGCSSENSSKDEINVYTRDVASGSRQAFESIIQLDAITNESAQTSNNGDMATQVGNNKNAIGYVSISTDFQANNLKKLAYEGVEVSIESVNNKEYKLARPFLFITRAKGDYESNKKEQLILAFIDYMQNSIEGKEFILAAGGVVDVSEGRPWQELKKNHPIVNQDNSNLTIVTGGSTSVSKTLTRVISSFIPLAGNFEYQPNHTGSSDGYKRTLGSEKDGANKIDIGFVSREFKESENTDSALKAGEYAKDAIVVVVNEENQVVDNLNKEQLNKIFSKEIKLWQNVKDW